MFDPETLARDNIRRLRPYTSARSEFTGTAEIYIDANENPFGSPGDVSLNRYPDPLQRALKEKIAAKNGVKSEQIFVGNGSDEAIDLLFRIFCEPGRDKAVICTPTYGMYQVAADINDVRTIDVPLTAEFQLDAAAVVEASSAAKLVFICSPNNPTGNAVDRDEILRIAERFNGIVVVDEAYIDFSAAASLVEQLEGYPNLVVLQTFSKAWGMAGARVGLAFGNEKIIELFNRVKPPYNVNELSQKAAISALDGGAKVSKWIEQIIEQRASLRDRLAPMRITEKVYPSDSNFLLVKFSAADEIYEYLLGKGIVVRNRSRVPGCEGCLRLTVGTLEENEKLIAALTEFEQAVKTPSIKLESTI
ncbi:MAG: histidinol-phosphate transaminase [Acidobacteriota bacterium]